MCECKTSDRGEESQITLDGKPVLLGELVDRLNELEYSFSLRWKASLRATKAWQAETGEELTWPSSDDLTVWLLRRMQAAANKLETRGGKNIPDADGAYRLLMDVLTRSDGSE